MGGDSSSSSKIGYGTITTSAPSGSIAPSSPYYSKKSKGSKDSKASKDSSSKKDIKGTSSKTDKSLKGKGKDKGGVSSTMVPTSTAELTMGT